MAQVTPIYEIRWMVLWEGSFFYEVTAWHHDVPLWHGMTFIYVMTQWIYTCLPIRNSANHIFQPGELTYDLDLWNHPRDGGDTFLYQIVGLYTNRFIRERADRHTHRQSRTDLMPLTIDSGGEKIQSVLETGNCYSVYSMSLPKSHLCNSWQNDKASLLYFEHYINLSGIPLIILIILKYW